jgi:hypothetical protein
MAKLTSQQKVAAFRARQRGIERRLCEDQARRKRLEADPVKWMRHYLENTFPLPFSAGHLRLIGNIVIAAKTGEGTATAQPRGEGKTTVCRGALLYLVFARIVRFPVIVGWKHLDAREGFGQWLTMLTGNPRLLADYPEICQPYERSIHATALRNLTWSDTGAKTGAMVDTMSKVITLPGSIGAIAARSAQGDAKGLQAMLPDGSVLRPDFLIIDDAQDPKQADNPGAVRRVIDILENVFLGLAGRQRRLACAVACTIEAEGDVSCHWLSRQGWTSEVVSRIPTWPDGSSGGTWDAGEGDPARRLWDEWRGIYLEHGQQAANDFFREHEKAMVGKMSVSWNHGYDQKLDVGPYDAAMREWYDKGADVFSRAQQNQPIKRGVDVYRLTPEIVVSRTTEREAFRVEQRTEVIVAGSDVNPSYAITSVLAGFACDLSCDYLWYGRYADPPLPCTDAMSETQRQGAIYGALWKHGESTLLRAANKPSLWGIDGGGAQSAAAKKFRAEWNRAHPELPVIVMYGRAGKSARVSARNETIRQRGDNWILCRDREPAYGVTEWVLWHADAWREIQQRAWTCEPGAPGGATLPRGHHRDFAEEICRERLRAKGLVGDRMFWDFERSPGKNDFADAANMCYVLASIKGVGTGGRVEKQGRPLARAVIGRPSQRRK